MTRFLDLTISSNAVLQDDMGTLQCTKR